MRIAIFGKSNSLAHGLQNVLMSGGNTVEIFAKSVERGSGAGEHYFDIEKGVAPDLAGFDLIIYSSWIGNPRSRKTAKKNIATFTAIVAEAQRCNTRIIFISTLGVMGNSASIHVQAKRKCEALLPEGSIIVRPATVVDYDSRKIFGALRLLIGTTATPAIRVSTAPQILVPTVSLHTVLRKIYALAFTPQEETTKEVNLIEQIAPGSWPLSPNPVSDSRALVLPLSLLVAMLSAARVIRRGRDAWDSWKAIRGLQDYLQQVSRLL